MALSPCQKGYVIRDPNGTIKGFTIHKTDQAFFDYWGGDIHPGDMVTTIDIGPLGVEYGPSYRVIERDLPWIKTS